MHTDTFIVGRNVILRPPRESDASYIVEWINDPKIRHYLMRRMPLSLLAEKDWIAKSSKLEAFPDSIMLMIETKDEGKPIGNMALHGINWVHRTATTGSLIGSIAHQGKGYATDAKMHFLRYAFLELNLHKIISLAYRDNLPSIRYSERCGYVREAVHKDEVFHQGKRMDIVRLACFYDTWKQACATNGWSALI